MPALEHGGRVTLRGTTVAARPELAGTVERDDLRGFALTRTDASGTVTTLAEGRLQLRVVRTRGGTLDFNYRFRELRLAPGVSIRAVTMFGFYEFDCDVDYRTDGLGEIGPPAANRSGRFLYPVTFEFTNGLTRDSYFFFIKTPETQYDRDNVLLVQGADGSGPLTTRIDGGFAPATS